MSTPTQLAARQWLAEAGPDPDHARLWWGTIKVVLMPLGHKWDAVKVGEKQGQQALVHGIEGPVIHDRSGKSLFFLVPVGTSSAWTLPGTECLGDTCYLTIPAPDRTEPPGIYWLRAPDGSGLLVDPVALRTALQAAVDAALGPRSAT